MLLPQLRCCWSLYSLCTVSVPILPFSYCSSKSTAVYAQYNSTTTTKSNKN